MPHSLECWDAVEVLGLVPGDYCIGGCTMTRKDVPHLYDMLVGAGSPLLKTERRMPTLEEFEITEDHLKLAQRMYWQWDDSGYEGAPAVGLKRPYGNSDIGQDIAEILGWDYPDEDEVSPREFDERVDDIDAHAMKIHREMDTVLQIATCTLSWKPGVYMKKDQYDSLSWELVE